MHTLMAANPAGDASYQLQLDRYLAVVWRRKTWIIATTLVIAAALLGSTYLHPRSYLATAEVLIEPSQSSVSLQNNLSATLTPQQVATASQLVTSAPIVATVKRTLGREAYSISSTPGVTDDIVSVQATAGHAGLAARVANTYARAFVRYERSEAIASNRTAIRQVSDKLSDVDGALARFRSQLARISSTKSPRALGIEAEINALLSQQGVLQENLAQLQVTESTASGGALLVSSAAVPDGPVSRHRLLFGGVGLAAGLFLGCLVAAGIDARDDSVRSKEDLTKEFPTTPILGLIPAVSGWRKTEREILVAQTDPYSAPSEAYRSLRTSLEFYRLDSKAKVFLVTSSIPKEGKTATVANLGVLMAQAGHKTLVVSADLLRPRLGRFFGLEDSTGLTSSVLNDSPVFEAIHQMSEIPLLSFIGSGPAPFDSSALLASQHIGDAISSFREDFDIVLIDSAPIIPVSDSLVLARYADALLLVVGMGGVRRKHLARVHDLLRNNDIEVTGLILNEVATAETLYEGYSYEYGYRYRQDPKHRSRVAGD